MPLPELTETMNNNGWRGDPLDVVQTDEGLLSVDNRRVVAARGAGLDEVPVKVHPSNEPFPPPDMAPQRANSFNLRNPIRRDPTTGGLTSSPGPGEVVYPAGTRPQTWGEAAMFRTANQGESIQPGRFPDNNYFPVGGTRETPIVKPPRGGRGGGGNRSGGGGGNRSGGGGGNRSGGGNGGNPPPPG